MFELTFRKVIITVTEKRRTCYRGKVRYMISDAAALAGGGNPCVTLLKKNSDLTIPRNEMGSILYKGEHTGIPKIKELKEKGYQLKGNPHDIT